MTNKVSLSLHVDTNTNHHPMIANGFGVCILASALYLFTLHIDCIPAFYQSLPYRWSVLLRMRLGLQTETRTPPILQSYTDYAFICEICL